MGEIEAAKREFEEETDVTPTGLTFCRLGIVALLIAVFPANIYLYQHQDVLPAPPIIHFLRLPLQGLFILWAYWHTQRGAESGR